MDKQQLILFIESGLSTYQISKKTNCSQTNVRYWLRKFGLNTKSKEEKKQFLDARNELVCGFCQKDLTGYKKRFCNNKCKDSFYYAKGKENGNTNERQKKVAQERKLELIKMSGGACQVCGYSKNYSALCFHHLNPKNKSFSLDARRLSNTKWESLVEEWKKCQLLCHNCHAEIHFPKNLVGEPGVEPGFRANLALNEV